MNAARLQSLGQVVWRRFLPARASVQWGYTLHFAKKSQVRNSRILCCGHRHAPLACTSVRHFCLSLETCSVSNMVSKIKFAFFKTQSDFGLEQLSSTQQGRVLNWFWLGVELLAKAPKAQARKIHTHTPLRALHVTPENKIKFRTCFDWMLNYWQRPQRHMDPRTHTPLPLWAQYMSLHRKDNFWTCFVWVLNFWKNPGICNHDGVTDVY